MLVDVLFISETKLDSYFSQAQFHLPGNRSFRNDRTDRGGGHLAYVRSDLRNRQRPDLELKYVESIIIETRYVTANGRLSAPTGRLLCLTVFLLTLLLRV